MKTRLPATSISSGGFGVPGGTCFFNSSQSGLRSAVVTWPVASTKARNCALVTSVSSIQNGGILTRWAGRSAGHASRESDPIMKTPPGSATMPVMDGPGSDGAVFDGGSCAAVVEAASSPNAIARNP